MATLRGSKNFFSFWSKTQSFEFIMFDVRPYNSLFHHTKPAGCLARRNFSKKCLAKHTHSLVKKSHPGGFRITALPLPWWEGIKVRGNTKCRAYPLRVMSVYEFTNPGLGKKRTKIFEVEK